MTKINNLKLNFLHRSDTHEMVNLLLGEFRIKYCELEFKKPIKTGTMSTIYQVLRGDM